MDFTVLECKHFVAPSAKTLIKRTVTDYEFDFHVKGGRRISIDGRESLINAGDISIRKPGQTVYSFGDYDCYILTLDFSKCRECASYSRNTVKELQPLSEDSCVCFLPDTVSAAMPSEYQSLFVRLLSFSDIDSEEAKDTVRKLLYMMNLDAVNVRLGASEAKCSEADIIYAHIKECFREEITLDSLSELVHLDKSYLSRIFKRRYGISPIDFVIRLRLDDALGLVANTDMSISQIADCCGYRNVSFFISAYKKRYGMSPKEHRREYRAGK